MGQRINQLKLFSLSDWKILFTSSMLLAIVALSLKLTGLKQTQSLLSRKSPVLRTSSPPTQLQLQEAKRIASLVCISATHGIYRTNCLKQVLVLEYYLNKKGIASTMYIGVRKNQESLLDAHAWLECAGTPLIDSKKSLQQFSSILSKES
jgi:hypothetical protein